MSASFQVEEEGFSHQSTMPDVPGPDALPSEEEMQGEIIAAMPEPMRTYYERERPIEMRPVEIQRYMSQDPMPPIFHVWIRATGPLPDDPAIHQAVLAYASDMTLLDTSLMPHGHTVFDHDHPGREPRPRAVVPSALPRRRVAALRAGQPDRLAARAAFRAGSIFKQDGTPRRLRRPGRPDPRSRLRTCLIFRHIGQKLPFWTCLFDRQPGSMSRIQGLARFLL